MLKQQERGASRSKPLVCVANAFVLIAHHTAAMTVFLKTTQDLYGLTLEIQLNWFFRLWHNISRPKIMDSDPV